MAALTADAAEPRSFWAIHAGHVLLLAAWLVVFAVVYARSMLAERRAVRRADALARPPAPALARSVWVWVAAGFSLLAGAVHLSIVKEHFVEAALYGYFFTALTLLQFGWAATTLARPSRALLRSGAAASTLVVLLWLATRTIGIPVGPAAGETEPFGGLDIFASASEVVVAIAAWRAGVASTGLPIGRPAVSPQLGRVDSPDLT